jgi:hypothetical protein
MGLEFILVLVLQICRAYGVGDDAHTASPKTATGTSPPNRAKRLGVRQPSGTLAGDGI